MARNADSLLGAAVLEALDIFWQEQAYPPTCRDLAAAAHCSCSTVHLWLERLVGAGVIELRGGHPVPKWVLARLAEDGGRTLAVQEGADES